MKKPLSSLSTPYLLSNYHPIPECGCWIWGGSINSRGYGQVSRHGHIVTHAHRLFYAIHKGEIPAGLYVLHKCDTPACCNPDHLFIGTQADNMRDMKRKGRGRNAYSRSTQ